MCLACKSPGFNSHAPKRKIRKKEMYIYKIKYCLAIKNNEIMCFHLYVEGKLDLKGENEASMVPYACSSKYFGG
jgi:hypothetical protein